jgi:hypothetical protein
MTPEDARRIKEWRAEDNQRAREYFRAKNFWNTKGDPERLIAYAQKYGGALIDIPKLFAARVTPPGTFDKSNLVACGNGKEKEAREGIERSV